jgi:hypothetical protein
MNGQSDNPTTMPHLAAPGNRSWVIASIAGAIMILLALVGVALTNTSSASAPNYWIVLVPVYGILCIGTAWMRGRHNKAARGAQVIRQILHWLAIAAALALDFVIRGTGEETASAAGLNAMLLLALGCFLAGVHLEWFFAVVGVMLTVAMIILARAQQYMWVVFLLGGLAVAALIASRWLLGRWRARHGANQHPSPPASGS